ncbi:hypothetical protein CANARDRAFT_28454 [[Candida] arabinofermentans NRRL YB-2248]|uniref:CUE domain-containing protein n=1 Tax=[Candida] arabinofermentans NRRL YB-2248 TaxID=983967 RepID=A0A1E4T066_9ASCO|nr:hypothetical protein CANARDRAFT_28454 [[Candida] arabinofermentans NRRL YB-2248]
MDSSTLSLIAAIIIAFIFLSWLLNPENGSTTSPAAVSDSAGNSRRRRRVVTQEMIDSVSQIAIDCSVDQIRYDLERTGDVNETVDRYLSEHTLPNRPGLPLSSASSSTGAISNSRAGTGAASGSSRGTATSKSDNTSSKATAGKKSLGAFEGSGFYGGLTFEEKKRELIMKARARIEQKGEEIL